MTDQTRKLAPELTPPLRSDYCPQCGRVGVCNGTPECLEYTAHIERALDAAFARHMANVAALLFIEQLHRDVLEDERQHPLLRKEMAPPGNRLVERGARDHSTLGVTGGASS